MSKAISPDEKRWQLEDDVRALKAYAKLVDDKTRMKVAKRQLEKEIKEAQKLFGKV